MGRGENSDPLAEKVPKALTSFSSAIIMNECVYRNLFSS
jgi:hypothetical protein